MSPLTIEIHGTGTHNRGAELMACAIADRLHSSFPDIRLAVPPSFGDFEARARYAFYTTPEFRGRVINRGYARFMPRPLRRAAGLVLPEEIDVVLDASGFAFSDQWGPQRAINLLKKMSRRGRRHQRLILLPQALGPFEKEDVKSVVQALMERAELVCARDELSLAHARPLCDEAKLRKFPDFTVGMTPRSAENMDLPSEFSAIVPNIHMVDMTGAADAYYRFLAAAIQGLTKRGMNPVFVLHDAHEDRQVISTLAKDGIHLPVLEHPDPRVLKGILGKASLVIASRFHALVSSLSLGVPCIGAGWSHKYPELFKDFNCQELLVTDLAELERLDSILTMLAQSESRLAWEDRIRSAGALVRSQTGILWAEVESIIRASVACK